MKFFSRLTWISLLTFAILSSVTLLFNGNRQIRQGRIVHCINDRDLGVVRTYLNSTVDDDIPVLLRGILGRSGSRVVWKKLSRDPTAADSWIKIAHLLQKRRGYHSDGLAVTVEGNVSFGPPLVNHSDRDALDEVLDPDKIDVMRHLLYETLGYRNDRAKIRQREDAPLIVKERLVSDESPSYVKFQAGIRRYSLYTNLSQVNELLWDMAIEPIIDVIQVKGGTQIKLLFELGDGNVAIFKPMRFSRDTETLLNHFYFSDYERHTAEIAAFHLDRILDFRKVPPVTGRVVNVTRDIWHLTSDKTLKKTVFISPVGSVCFFGKCSYYCDSNHAICGRPELLEGSMAVFIPEVEFAERRKWRHPWKRSYSRKERAQWEKDPDYCDKVRITDPYNKTKHLLDIMDMAVFDFITGNMDRHHYETFIDFGNETFPILFDNGRGFGKTGHDEMSILAPVYQCCLFRASTLDKLLILQTGKDKKLSQLMRESLSSDPLAEVLTQRHLAALDRRVEKILSVVSRCIGENKKRGPGVIIDDGF